jgi:hypothetical protein
MSQGAMNLFVAYAILKSGHDPRSAQSTYDEMGDLSGAARLVQGEICRQDGAIVAMADCNNIHIHDIAFD